MKLIRHPNEQPLFSLSGPFSWRSPVLKHGPQYGNPSKFQDGWKLDDQSINIMNDNPIISEAILMNIEFIEIKEYGVFNGR